MLRRWTAYITIWLVVVFGFIVIEAVTAQTGEGISPAIPLGALLLAGAITFLFWLKDERTRRDQALEDFRRTGVWTVYPKPAIWQRPSAIRLLLVVAFLAVCIVIGLIAVATRPFASLADRIIAFCGVAVLAVIVAAFFKWARPPAIYASENEDEPPVPRLSAQAKDVTRPPQWRGGE